MFSVHKCWLICAQVFQRGVGLRGVCVPMGFTFYTVLMVLVYERMIERVWFVPG